MTVNAETQHQLYGGEIVDYITPNLPSKNNKTSNFVDPNSDSTLENIYNVSVKDKGSIDTSGIYRSSNVPLQSLIEREPDKFQQMLTDTLNQVAKDIGLIPNSSSSTLPSVTPKEQTANDIQQAQDNIAQALQELKDLNAI
jgi:hypothetical protein